MKADRIGPAVESTVGAVKKERAETATAFMAGKKPPETQGPPFDVPHGATADLDAPAMGATAGRWPTGRWADSVRRCSDDG